MYCLWPQTLFLYNHSSVYYFSMHKIVYTLEEQSSVLCLWPLPQIGRIHVLFVATTKKVIFTQIVHTYTIIVSNSIIINGVNYDLYTFCYSILLL